MLPHAKPEDWHGANLWFIDSPIYRESCEALANRGCIRTRVDFLPSFDDITNICTRTC